MVDLELSNFRVEGGGFYEIVMFHEHSITISSNYKMDTAWLSIRTGILLSLLGYKAFSPDYSRQSRKTV